MLPLLRNFWHNYTQPVSNDKKLSSHSSGKNSKSKADSSVLGASGST